MRDFGSEARAAYSDCYLGQLVTDQIVDRDREGNLLGLILEMKVKFRSPIHEKFYAGCIYAWLFLLTHLISIHPFVS